MPTTQDAELESLRRLSRDLKTASATLAPKEVRYLVDAYYQMQENRKVSANQVRALEEAKEPHEVIGWLESNASILERNIKSVLDAHTSSNTIGRWAKSIVGIGPVIAAGLAAHIDITKAPTVGHIWRFAGLDPTQMWDKGQKRPWNASLKVLCWKIGESFVKVSNHEDDFYGKLWKIRKEIEETNNLAGKLSDQATAKLDKFRIGKDTDARLWYAGCLTPEQAREILATPTEKRVGLAKKLAGEPGTGLPMLPPAHIHARAKRWTVKLFLAHWHHVAYEAHFKEPAPKPYVIEHMGHVHNIVPPNWESVRVTNVAGGQVNQS